MNLPVFCIVTMVNLITYAFLPVYTIDRVFRYEFKNRLAAYIVGLVMGCGVGVTIIVLKSHDSELYTIASGMIMEVLVLVECTVLAVLMRGKIWRRIVTAYATADIIYCISLIFSEISVLIANGKFVSGLIASNIIWFVLIELISDALQFLFLFLIAYSRSKKDAVPLPLSLVVFVFLILDVFTGIIPYDEPGSLPIENKLFRVVAFLLMLLITVLLFYIRISRQERDSLKKLNSINEELIRSQTKFFEASAKADSEIRAMRHDMRNNMQVLRMLLENGDNDKLKEYLDEMSEEISGTEVGSHTGNVIADAIIADKKRTAEEAGVGLDVTGTISNENISPVNMCKMLGNLLDNAIEAASDDRLKELPQDIRMISLQFKRTENFFMISVTNPCADRPVIKDGKFVTHKNDARNHGFGIKNVREAAEECGGELALTCDEMPYGYQFRAEIII